jgi:ribosomal protein S2
MSLTDPEGNTFENPFEAKKEQTILNMETKRKTNQQIVDLANSLPRVSSTSSWNPGTIYNIDKTTGEIAKGKKGGKRRTNKRRTNKRRTNKRTTHKRRK